MVVLFVIIILCVGTFFLIKNLLEAISQYNPGIEFIKNSNRFKINNKTYKYSDIKNITIDEDIGEYAFSERFAMGDLDNGRLINDRITFVLTEEEIIQTVETTSRRELYSILKTISKYKRLDFDINPYKPPFVTSTELIFFIIALILIYFRL